MFGYGGALAGGETVDPVLSRKSQVLRVSVNSSAELPGLEQGMDGFGLFVGSELDEESELETLLLLALLSEEALLLVLNTLLSYPKISRRTVM